MLIAIFDEPFQDLTPLTRKLKLSADDPMPRVLFYHGPEQKVFEYALKADDPYSVNADILLMWSRLQTLNQEISYLEGYLDQLTKNDTVDFDLIARYNDFLQKAIDERNELQPLLKATEQKVKSATSQQEEIQRIQAEFIS